MNDGQLTDFADDIALMEDTWHGMAEITTRVEREAGAVGLRINAGKTKLMVVSNVTDKGYIMAGGQVVETVEDFCYLGSVMSDNSSCDKDIKTRLGKANSVFGRLDSIWKSVSLNCNVKMTLWFVRFVNSSLRRRNLVNDCRKHEEAGSITPQMAKKNSWCGVEGQSEQ